LIEGSGNDGRVQRLLDVFEELGVAIARMEPQQGVQRSSSGFSILEADRQRKREGVSRMPDRGFIELF
jgi:hypothetical protein